ncbi:MAG: hypothetical protein AAF806_24340 [Bacteroidota bacterium]
MDFYLNQQNAYERIWKEYLTYNCLIVAYDFDNTVYDCHQKGWQFKQVIRFLRRLKKIGCYLIIFTANQDLNFVKTHCQKQDIPFDVINENAPFISSTARKIYYNALLDDRAGLRMTYDLLWKLSQQIMLQAEMQKIFLPLLEEKGKNYQKNKNVYARKAQKGERVETITKDGLETSNTAKEDSYVIRNQTNAQEQYIIGASKFEQRYQWLNKVDDKWSEYRSQGKIRALEVSEELLEKLDLSDPFYFIAAWGERMIARKGDFLACPKGAAEVYRIARKEFFETYVLDGNAD